MALTSLDIQNRTFQKKKLGGYDPDEVDDFLDHIKRDYEDLTQKNRELEKDLKHAKEKLSYFDELKDSLNESIIVAQDTASKVKSNASNEADVIVKTAEGKRDKLLADAEVKAKEILADAKNNAKELVVETDDLKKKTRVFHQRLTLLLESQLQTVKSTEWEEMLQPFSTYVEDEHQMFKELIDKQEEDALAKAKEVLDKANEGFETVEETDEEAVATLSEEVTDEKKEVLESTEAEELSQETDANEKQEQAQETAEEAVEGKEENFGGTTGLPLN